MSTKTLTVSNWGGNMGVRLPKEFAEMLGIKHKTKVHAEMVDGAIKIFPIKTSRNHIPLSERMAIALENGSWDGKPAEITQEDGEWIDMSSVGEETP